MTVNSTFLSLRTYYRFIFANIYTNLCTCNLTIKCIKIFRAAYRDQRSKISEKRDSLGPFSRTFAPLVTTFCGGGTDRIKSPVLTRLMNRPFTDLTATESRQASTVTIPFCTRLQVSSLHGLRKSRRKFAEMFSSGPISTKNYTVLILIFIYLTYKFHHQ